MRKLFLLFLLLVTVTVSAETLPRILTVSSDDLQDVGLAEPIVITFNLPMNQAQVESGIHLEPQTEITFHWIDQQTLAIMPQSEWLQTTFYTVTIAADVAAVSNETLNEPYIFQFRTTGILNILSVTPERDNREVIGENAQIAVAFDRPVVPLVTPSLQQDLLIPFAISPNLAGEGLWITTSLYVFTPDNPLTGGAEYTVTIPAGIETPDGSVLQEPYIWSFRTLNPQTVSITADDMFDTYYVLLDSSYTIEFSQPMDHTSTEAAISIEERPRSEPVPRRLTGDFEWNETSTTVTFMPRERAGLSGTVNVYVDTTALSADGFASLEAPVSQNFRLVDAPQVIRTSPGDSQFVVPGMTTFDITFNTRINNETLENRYTIEPQPQGEITPRFTAGSHFTLTFETEVDMTYRVTLRAGVEDIYGNAMVADYVSSFTTQQPEQPDFLRFNHTPFMFVTAGTYLENLQIPIQSSGDFDATFRIYEVPTFADIPAVLPLYYYNWRGSESPLYYQREYQNSETRFEPPTYAVPENIIHEWTVNFGDTPLESLNLNLPNGEPLPMGMYALEMDAPEIAIIDGLLLSVGNAGVTVKRGPGDTIVWVTDYATAQPLANVDVTAYRGDTAIPLGQTDSNGIVTLPESEQYATAITYIVAQGEGIYGAWYGGTQANPLPRSGSYIYTDRPVYRPGETVYFRGVLRDRDDMTYTVPQLDKVYISVDNNGGTPPSDPLYTAEVHVSEFGTFSGEFLIPEDSILDYAQLFVSDCPHDAEDCRRIYGISISFEVAHFRVPEYEVQVVAQDDEVIAGDPMNVLVSAKYYFGGAVSNAPVSWTTYSTYEYASYGYGNRTFGYSGNEQGFTFNPIDYRYSYAYAQPTMTMQTNSEGQYLITDVFEAEGMGSRITVEGAVRDESGETISGSTTLLVHPANVYLGLRPTPRFSSMAEPAAIDVLTVFPDSTPHPNRTVDLTITLIEWLNTSESFGVYQWERQETAMGTFTVDTDANGRGQLQFAAPQAGTYGINATTSDDEKRITTSTTTLYVVSEGQETGQTRFDTFDIYYSCGFTPEYYRLRLSTDKSIYLPGETAQIFIPNPFGAAATALITVERSGVMEQDVVVIEGDALTYELPLTMDTAPTAYFNITLMAAIDAENPNPRTLRGSATLHVQPIHKRLNVELSASAAQAAPGDEVQFTVRITDFEGNPVQGEVGLALTDEAVLALRPPNSGTLESAFYGSQGHWVNTYISVWALLAAPGNTSEGGCGGGGGGGGINAAHVRDNYIYTPLWEPHVVTNENGEATVTVTMPDNLTRWRLDARAVTADTRVGQAQMNIVSTLPLIVRPVAPRFFVMGDRAEIGAVINNQSTHEQTVNVTLQITGAAVADELTRTVLIAGGERARVVWLADINSLDGVDFTVYADSGLYQDAAKPTLTNADGVIPVYRFVAQDTAATSGILDSEMSQLEAISLPGRYSHVEGDLTVQLDASLAEIMLDSLEWLDNEHQQNFEYAVSRFLPKIVTSRALSEFGIQDAELQSELAVTLVESMDLLRRYQNSDGGFGWVRNTQSNPYITAYVVLGLVEAQAAGYTVDTTSASMFVRAVQYLRLQINRNVTFNTPDWQLNQQTFLLYVLARSDEDPAMMLAYMDRLYQERVQMSLAGRAYLLMAYQMVSLDDIEITALADDLLGTAILSATGTHWENIQPDYRSWDSDTRTTAVVLNALIQVRPEHPILPGAVRWLVIARRGDHWESTQETVWATMALNEWMVATGDLNANYTYDISFNDAILSQGTMQSPQDSEAIVIDVDNMQAGAINNLLINRGGGTGTLYYSAALNLQLPADEVPAISRGVVIERGIFALENEDYVLVDSAAVGDIVTVRIAFTLNQDIYFFALQDVLPAGLEVINPRLLTATRAGTQPIIERNRDSRFWSWATWYFDHMELRDTGAEISAAYLPRGTYVFSYQARAVTPGEFQASPARAYATYQPEVYGRTNGSLFTVSSAN
jgi:uncharacterized protein YfaS (alpha-2-macroglobulin family)